MHDTLRATISAHAGDRPTIGAPDRPWLTYDALRAQCTAVEAALRGFGIGPTDRVAIVLPNGPESASAFVAIAQAATTAPLNLAYREEEYDFYFSDLAAKALVVMQGEDGPAVAAARTAGLAILRVGVPEGAAAGAFELSGEARDPAPAAAPGPGDIALILHTSGTTSRPKIVPLRQSNVAASAEHIRASLDLSPEDVCLNWPAPIGWSGFSLSA